MAGPGSVPGTTSETNGNRMTQDIDPSSPVRRTAMLSAVVFLAIAVATALVAYNFRDKDPRNRVLAVADSTVAGSDRTGGGASSTDTATNDTTADTSAAAASSDTTASADTSDSTTVSSSTAADTTGLSTGDTTGAVPTTRQARVGTIACPALDGSSPRVAAFDAAPPQCIDSLATYSAVIESSEGTMTISLDQRKAPKTANNFVYLARYHFYDGLNFHRVIPGFVVQGGDPEGNGQGGPGYEFADELPDRAGYPVGAMAMANSGPNTNGSQFFIVSGDLGLALPGQYTLFGKVTKGLPVVTAIDNLGKQPAPDGTEYPPSRAVTITSITIKAVGEKASRIPGLSASTTTTTTTTSSADTTAA